MQVLFAQPTYLWGYVSVQRIFDKVQLKQDVPAIIPMELNARLEGKPRDVGPPAARLGLCGRAGGISETAQVARHFTRHFT